MTAMDLLKLSISMMDVNSSALVDTSPHTYVGGRVKTCLGQNTVALQASMVSSDLFIVWQAEDSPPEPVNVILCHKRDLMDNHGLSWVIQVGLM